MSTVAAILPPPAGRFPVFDSLAVARQLTEAGIERLEEEGYLGPEPLVGRMV